MMVTALIIATIACNVIAEAVTGVQRDRPVDQQQDSQRDAKMLF